MKNLNQIRQESKEIKDKIDDTEERLRQLKNQEKKILKQDIVKRRIDKNEIVDGKLNKNYLFNSPSYAAAFVLGTNANGRTSWKNEKGITLKDLEEYEMK